jgi:hypothetical protein
LRPPTAGRPASSNVSSLASSRSTPAQPGELGAPRHHVLRDPPPSPAAVMRTLEMARRAPRGARCQRDPRGPRSEPASPPKNPSPFAPPIAKPPVVASLLIRSAGTPPGRSLSSLPWRRPTPRSSLPSVTSAFASAVRAFTPSLHVVAHPGSGPSAAGGRGAQSSVSSVSATERFRSCWRRPVGSAGLFRSVSRSSGDEGAPSVTSPSTRFASSSM